MKSAHKNLTKVLFITLSILLNRLFTKGKGENLISVVLKVLCQYQNKIKQFNSRCEGSKKHNYQNEIFFTSLQKESNFKSFCYLYCVHHLEI